MTNYILKFRTKIAAGLLIVLMLSGCATYQPQSKLDLHEPTIEKEVAHTFYIAGGLGTATPDANPELQTLLKSYLETADEESTLFYTGNYTPKKGSQKDNEAFITAQINMAKEFKGKTVFIPGHHEWSSNKTKEIEWVEDFLKDKNFKDISVQPNNVCPLEYVEFDDTLDILYVDSNWFFSNWDYVEGINKKCTDINTKRRFNEEFEGYVKDARGKNLLIVMHHPIFSNGKYAGKDTFWESMTPLPILGSVINEIND
ncbi:MAG TPA: hypothetical protein VKZ98_12275, partial [Aquaticitalea sp.]|nr:hypothetical protein [Aquaticitalea sp.]